MLSTSTSSTPAYLVFCFLLCLLFQPALTSPTKISAFKPSISASQGGPYGSPSSSDFHFIITLPLGTTPISSFRIRSLNSIDSYVPSGVLVALEAGGYFLDVTDSDTNIRVTDDEFFVRYEGSNQGYANICVYLFAENLDDSSSSNSYHESAFEIRIPVNNNHRDDLVYVLRENVHVNGGRIQGTPLPTFVSPYSTILHTTTPITSTISATSTSSSIMVVSTDYATVSGSVSVSEESVADAPPIRSARLASSTLRFPADADLYNSVVLPAFYYSSLLLNKIF